MAWAGMAAHLRCSVSLQPEFSAEGALNGSPPHEYGGSHPKLLPVHLRRESKMALLRNVGTTLEMN